jgi:hypothetical protein
MPVSPTTTFSFSPCPHLHFPAGSLNWTDPDSGKIVVYSPGDIAWVLASTALVWIMIPGVGFFYSGLLRRKNALSMIYLSMMTVAVVSFQVRCSHAISCVVLFNFNHSSSGSFGDSHWHLVTPHLLILATCVRATSFARVLLKPITDWTIRTFWPQGRP